MNEKPPLYPFSFGLGLCVLFFLFLSGVSSLLIPEIREHLESKASWILPLQITILALYFVSTLGLSMKKKWALWMIVGTVVIQITTSLYLGVNSFFAYLLPIASLHCIFPHRKILK